jgi:hypothetical protein
MLVNAALAAVMLASSAVSSSSGTSSNALRIAVSSGFASIAPGAA